MFYSANDQLRFPARTSDKITSLVGQSSGETIEINNET